ncbi:hypothetical protein MG293_000489, partial [Ovis ammon polii]
SVGKESACNAGDLASILESGRFRGEGNCNPCQYSSLEDPMDRGTWQATVHVAVRVAQEFGERNRRGLSPFPPLPLSSLGGPLAHPVRQTVTVQHPQKS